MEKNDLFDFEMNEAEGCWSVTGYIGEDEEVIFPPSHEGKPVKIIGEMFSSKRIKIKRVTIPEGYTSIEYSAFADCTELTEIKLPESLTSIGGWAFEGCTGLTGITFPEGLTSIEHNTFEGCTGLTEINLPKRLTSIMGAAFSGCTGLTKIIFPEGLTTINYDAFSGCTGLTNIKLPKGLTSLSPDAFADCMWLAEINVDENNPVFRAVDGVMFDKAMTTLMKFPEGKKGNYSVPDGIIAIRSNAFDNCKLTGITFPESLIFIDSYGFNSDQLTDITVSELSQDYCSIDGVLFDKFEGGRALLEYPKNKDKTDYAVPDGIRYIADNAFCRCKRLVNIVLPESIRIIRNNVFEGCEGLTAITLPMGLQYIGERAFNDCPNLETVTLSRKTRIGHKAFDGFKGRFIYRG